MIQLPVKLLLAFAIFATVAKSAHEMPQDDEDSIMCSTHEGVCVYDEDCCDENAECDFVSGICKVPTEDLESNNDDDDDVDEK
ncbi:hypothetical protein BJV82DRAFT_612620 [Fennellomyces sp. T-0311]|nr:hypothetical protein BJV82DRAFT_612620 [Fennellomyces sp. T-0311]